MSKQEIEARIKVLYKQLWKNMESENWDEEHQLLDSIYNEAIIKLQRMLRDNF